MIASAFESERSGLLVAFGRNLRAEREHRRLSQEAFAALANVHRTHLCALELGQREPHLSMLLILAHALDVKPDTLLHGLRVPVERKPATHSMAAPCRPAEPRLTRRSQLST
jgi:transcriptional regulator with XRE-family HTH domain